jgi:hypothetical protein
MRWRKRAAYPQEAKDRLEDIQRAEEELAVQVRKVQDSNRVIMSEVSEHRKLLRENNFARRIREALGGAGG